MIRKKNTLFRKLMVTFGIIFIFLLGMYIPVPGVDLSTYVASKNATNNLGTTLLGGNLSSIGLFSLGIGPSMTTMILIRLLSIGKRSSASSKKMQDFKMNSLMFVIATIQGLALATSFQYGGDKGTIAQLALTTLCLVTGSFVVNWLGNLIAAYGFGGLSVLVVVGMISGQFTNIPILIELCQNGYQVTVAVLTLWTLVAMYIMVIFERAEYRISVMRISIHNRLVDAAYMPIKVNASGGMAFMYVYSLLAFPQYIIILLRAIYPNDIDYTSFINYFSLTSVSGVVLYMILMLILSISFTFVNIDPTQIAENMRQSGDYIPGYRPGKETQTYLSKLCYLFGSFSGLFMALVGGLPLIAGLIDSDIRTLASATGVFMMLTSMSFMILDELRVIQIRKKYTSIFEVREK